MRRSRATPPATSGTDNTQEGSFLSRWARRKRIAREGGDPDREPDGPAEPSADRATHPADRPREELADADMPAVDSIDEHTDMSGFFSSKVSDGLKRAALRKFFHSSAFNVVDGLDDYAEDFTSFAPLGDIVTSDMRHRMEVEAERARAAAEAELAGEAPPADIGRTGETGGAGAEAADDARADADDGDDAGTAHAAPADADAAEVTREGAAGAVSGKLRRRNPEGDQA